MLITVVTVCYNAGYDLDKTVRSVLEQTYGEFEYVIKDGLSTDGSVERLPADPRIRLVREKDGGIFDAMNQALHIANGAFINFLNAGDTFYNDGILQAVADSCERHPEVNFFYGNFFKTDSRSNFITVPEKLSRYWVFSHSLCHQAWFLSKRCQIENGGYSTETGIGGDYLMLLDLVAGKQVKTQKIDRFLVRYQGGGQSANPELMASSVGIRKRKRKEMFTNAEYILFSMMNIAQEMMKRLLYDTVLYRAVKAYKWKKYS